MRIELVLKTIIIMKVITLIQYKEIFNTNIKLETIIISLCEIYFILKEKKEKTTPWPAVTTANGMLLLTLSAIFCSCYFSIHIVFTSNIIYAHFIIIIHNFIYHSIFSILYGAQ